MTARIEESSARIPILMNACAKGLPEVEAHPAPIGKGAGRRRTSVSKCKASVNAAPSTKAKVANVKDVARAISIPSSREARSKLKEASRNALLAESKGALRSVLRSLSATTHPRARATRSPCDPPMSKIRPSTTHETPRAMPVSNRHEGRGAIKDRATTHRPIARKASCARAITNATST